MKQILIAILTVGSFASSAQQLHFSDIYLYGYSGSATATPLSAQDQNFLRGNLTTSNVQNVKLSDEKFRYSNGIGIMAAWNVRTRPNPRFQQKLRLGVSFGNYGLNANGSWRNETATHIDTFISQQTGEQLYVDSIFYQNASINHQAQMFNVEANYILTLNADRKLSFIAGLGIQAGVSLQNYMQSRYSEDNRIEYMGTYNSNNNHIHNNALKLDNSTRILPTLSTYNAFIPLGLNYRLSNRSNFLRHINLFGELNLGLELSHMQGINTNLGFYSGMKAGVRVSFN